MPTTAAISAGVGAAGSLGAAGIGAWASGKASSQQVQAQMAALAQQKALYEQGLGVQSGYVNSAADALNPFIGVGGAVGKTLQSLLTPGSSAATLSQMPGFAFASQYGTNAATNALAARGGASGGGNLATAISQYNNGLAGQQYFNTVNALQNTFGTGAQAAGTLANIYGGAGNAALGAGVNEGQVQGQTYGNIGNAQASGTLGISNALAGGLTGTSSGISNALLYSQLFGNGGGGFGGLYTPAQINALGNLNASTATDAKANAYGVAMGLTP